MRGASSSAERMTSSFARTACTQSCTESSCWKKSWRPHEVRGFVTTPHDDDVLGKAYDARLMRRLLQYLRPYWRAVSVALVTIVVGGIASLMQPYLIKVAIDRY